MDIPESAKHKNHKVPIPLTGGVVLIILVTIMTLLTGIWENPQVIGNSSICNDHCNIWIVG